MAGECVTVEYMDQVFSFLKKQLEDLAERIEELGTRAVKAKTGRTGKRKPSKYNKFIGLCMRGTGKTMKTCAAEYKTAKSDGSLDSIIAKVPAKSESEGE